MRLAVCSVPRCVNAGQSCEFPPLLLYGLVFVLLLSSLSWPCFFPLLSLSGKCNIVCARGYRAPNVVTIVFSPTSTHISVSLHLILSRFILVSQGFFLLFTRLKEKQCSLYFTFPPASTLHLLSRSVFGLALPPPSALPSTPAKLCIAPLVCAALSSRFAGVRRLMISQLLSHSDRSCSAGNFKKKEQKTKKHNRRRLF